MAVKPMTLFKYIPLAAVIYAVYQVYQDRGVEGLMADIMAIARNPQALVSKVGELLVPLALIFVAPSVIRKYAPGGSVVKYGLIGIVLYGGITQVAAAVRQGAGRGYIRAGPMTASSVYQGRR